MHLYYSHPNAISIFTDVSTASRNAGFICPGFIAIQGGKGGRVLYSDYRVLNGSSSQFGEHYAIMMALTFMNVDVWSKRNRGLWQEVDNTVYNLFSDSVHSLTCLKKLPDWVSLTNQAINNFTHPTFDYNSLTKVKTINDISHIIVCHMARINRIARL